MLWRHAARMLHSASTMPLWAAYLVVFTASCCTLILELVAGRILAPYIGVSLYTWTSIIGVVLAGISLGNWLGGKAADRWPRRGTLGILLALGGFLSLAILPLINIANAIPTGQLIDAADKLGGGLRLDRALILVARIVTITTIIFFPPSFVLGMISPVVVKLTLRDLSSTGSFVGKIYALSTLGSILGTFATGFVLVQLMGTRMIVLGVSIVLLAMAVLFGDLLRVRRAVLPLAAVLLLVGATFPARSLAANGCFGADDGAPADCVTRSVNDGWTAAINSGCLTETSYYCIRVHDDVLSSDHLLRVLVLDHLIHSYNSLEDPSYLKYGYIQVYAEVADYLARRLPNQDLRILYIGGGGYTLPRHIEATYPNARQEVVEIDPGVTRTVYDRLGVDPLKTRIVTYNVDGRLMLNQLVQDHAGEYDLVIGDAFNDVSIPYHLTTQEFDQGVKKLLKDDGYYLALVIDKLRGGKFITAYAETLKTVWPTTAVLADGVFWESTAPSTYVVAGGNRPLDLDRLREVRGAGAQGQRVTRAMPQDLMDAWLAEARAPVLTDDYAPVDNLIAPIFAERGF